jgi:ABC-2 type transport system ATP-binding protein
MEIIEIDGLRKRFKGRRGTVTAAVDGLDLIVPEGGVFALLGPNGAGKTTTLRCLLGLVRPTSGHLRILGANVPDQLHSVLPQVGSILETPAFHPAFTGKENLLLLGRLSDVGEKTVDDALEKVDLRTRADDRVSAYSLGMRQRLGVAAALMKSPALVILDEPTNGLDPAGIAQMRELLRGIADSGRTVLVSSHLLSEIALIADYAAIMSLGKCVFSGTMRELLATPSSGCLILRIDDTSSAAAVLTKAGFQIHEEGDTLRITAEPSEAPVVGARLAAANLFPLELRSVTTDLETVFLRLTSDPAGALR